MEAQLLNKATIAETGTKEVLQIENLYKSFGKDNEVLKGITLSIKKGENLVLLGRSGSGKSVIIKCVVALVEADKGSIQLFGTDIKNLSRVEMNLVRLRVGFLFQNSALYDSMTVRQNLAFPLRHQAHPLTFKETDDAIHESLENVGLTEVIDKMPSELSGGMRKRVALARTLILKPELMLYDEPTTGLDTITSNEISDLILSIQKKYKTSSVIITHDMACAKKTGDRLMILKDGVIEAEGSFDELKHGKDEWVRSFF
jgi:phospholipid/cholesterol/gamma-HCH transport system ATP-binding protein